MVNYKIVVLTIRLVRFLMNNLVIYFKFPLDIILEEVCAVWKSIFLELICKNALKLIQFYSMLWVLWLGCLHFVFDWLIPGVFAIFCAFSPWLSFCFGRS